MPTDELKDALNKPNEQATPPIGDNANQRISKLSEDLAKKETEKQEIEAKRLAAEKEATDAKNELAFLKLPSALSKAQEHKDEILAKAASAGLTIEEAATLVLAKAGKYDASASASDASGMGGGAIIQPKLPNPEAPKTQQERRIRLEALKKEDLGDAVIELIRS